MGWPGNAQARVRFGTRVCVRCRWHLGARSEGLEPPTVWFEARYSIQLSYERLVVLEA